jgi:transcriptional regulator with XRE-family HTH domain
VSLLSPDQLVALRSVPCDDNMPNRVRVAAAMAGVTQAAIVESTGLVQAYVSDVMRGRYQTITTDNAHKFAEFFGCAIEDLFPARAEERQAVGQ